MSTITDALKAGAAVAVAVTLAGVAALQLLPGVDASAGHVRVGSAPVGSVGLWATALASPEALVIFGIDAGAPLYVRARVCALPVVDGSDPGQDVLRAAGLVVVYDDDATAPCVSGVDPVLEAWTQGRSDAPWTCACAADATCIQGDTAAPLGRYLEAGTWVGPGCVPKPCIELAGVSSWPAACPLQ